MISTKSASERTSRNPPTTICRRKLKTFHHTETLGCGVESSRLPHWEQTSATRGFTLLELTAAEKQDLERWAQSRTLPAGDVFRARLILALADGQSYREMVRGMRTQEVLDRTEEGQDQVEAHMRLLL